MSTLRFAVFSNYKIFITAGKDRAIMEETGGWVRRELRQC